MATDTSDPLHALLQTPSAKVELESLQKINTHLNLLHVSQKDTQVDDLLEEVDLPVNGCIEIDPVSYCVTQQRLNLFTCYIFDRRFGWSEANTDSGRRVRRMSSTGTVFESSDGHQKAIINEFLDSFIKWYMQQELSASLSEAFQYTLKQVEKMPVVRKRAVIHIMEWLKENRGSLSDCQTSHLILDLIRTSLTDVWSAIRSACAKHLGHVICYFTAVDQETLFNTLTRICKSDESTWQAKEGAIMGINAIIQQYHENAGSRSHTPQFTLDTDTQVLSRHPIPTFVSSQIHLVVFSLLSHPQLTIRENSAKALSTYIASSDAKETLSTFEQVITLLWKGCGNCAIENSHVMKLPVKFLDAYAAEGIIDVCLVLVKVLPLSQLLPRWPRYMSTFLLYLSHPASTVRQAASSIFKYLVAKSSHCAVLVKLVLQALTEGWEPDMEALNREEKFSDSTPLNRDHRPSVCDSVDGDILDTWESREGRLFAFELILKFLIKNHWWYTFGPAGVGLHVDLSSDVNQDKSADTRMSEEYTSSNGNPQPDHRNTETFPSGISSHPVRASDSELSFALRFLTQDVPTEFKDARHINRIETPSKGARKGSIPSRMDNVYSILMQIKVIESFKEQENCHTNSSQRQLRALEEILMGSLEESTQSNQEHVNSWLQGLKVESLGHCLIHILHQTLECLADSRWELKRMAQQVLPCLAEVMRWFDTSILQDLWRTHLSHKTSLFTYGAALLLKESITHTVKLQPLLHKHPSSWQDHDICKKIISNIVSSLVTQLDSCLPCLNKILQRPTYDRLSIIAASTIIIAHNHFNISDDQRLSQTATVLSFWKLLFCFTHPLSRISQDLLHGSTDIRLFTSPFEGYLSCCLVRPENKLQCAKQVEKLLVTESFFAIKLFMQNLPAASSCLMLPIISHYVGLFLEDTHVCKALSECLRVVGAQVVDFTNSPADDYQRRTCLKCINFTLKELSAIITMKSTEVFLVQKVLNIYITMCKVINPQKHLRLILVAICSRISEDIYFSVEHSPRPGDDLTLLSNDIPMSSSPDNSLQWDSEEVGIIVGSPGQFPECLTLDLSNNSGSLQSGRLSALSQHSDKGRSKSPTHSEEGKDKDEGNDDWDSWDEDEDEGHSALKEAFCEFLEKLQKVCNTGSKDVFSTEMSKLDTRERSLILEIMDG